MNDRLKLTLPKGSLEESTIAIFRSAFYELIGHERTYRPIINDEEIEVKILRPQEIPIYVSRGVFDVGITGLDWIVETNANVKQLLDLEYGRVKIVSGIPKSVDRSPDLYLDEFWKDGGVVRISTEYPNIASKYIMSLNSYKRRFDAVPPTVVTPWWVKEGNDKAVIYLSFGATEAKPPEEAELIVEVTETGITLEQNNLKVGDNILKSSARLIANKASLSIAWKREKILNLMAMLKGVVESRKRVHIFLNVRKENLDRLLNELPALKAPTVSSLSKTGWVAINTVIMKKDLAQLMPKLRRLAQGLVVHDARQILSLEEVEDGVR
jgi:ATP phosphoribosyltransferase